MKDIQTLVKKLSALNVSSTSTLVQIKTKTALANIKRARTLLEKAELTLTWAERETSPLTSKDCIRYANCN